MKQILQNFNVNVNADYNADANANLGAGSSAMALPRHTKNSFNLANTGNLALLRKTVSLTCVLK